MDRDWVAYVGPFPFPWGEASSRRVLGVSRSIAATGREVVVGCGNLDPSKPACIHRDASGGSISYVGLGESIIGRGIRKAIHVFILRGRRTKRWLASQPVKPSHVILYGGSAQYACWLLPWCKANRVPLIVDVVEWYQGSHQKGGVIGPFNVSAKIALRFLYPLFDGVIAISRYLTQYYEGRGCKVVRIPPTVDVGEPQFSRGADMHGAEGPLRLVYAGSPGKKDLLPEIMAAIVKVDPAGDLIQFSIIGPTREQVVALNMGEQLPNNIVPMGRVAQEKVYDLVRAADFSIILRADRRYAQAGFPTKLVESLATGTPVIANYTGDIGLYLRDMVEGLVVDGASADALASTLRRALRLTRSEINKMRGRARVQAANAFSFERYSASIDAFLLETREVDECS